MKTAPAGGFSALVVVAVIGLMSVALEALGEPGRLALRFDRQALAEGEWWRLATGHLVHLGPSHMLMNVGAMAVLWFVFKPWLTARDWIVTAVAAVAAIDAGLYWAHPQVEWYVGLSGVLHGIWAAAGIRGIGTKRAGAGWLAVVLLLKLGYEALIGPVAVTGAIAGGSVITAAHVWGSIGGAIIIAGGTAIRALRPSI